MSILDTRYCDICNTKLIPVRIGSIAAIFWECLDCRAYVEYTQVRREGERKRLLLRQGEFKEIEVRDL